MSQKFLKVAWISDFPVEWLDEIPAELGCLPLQHPIAWLRCLLAELEREPTLCLHILILRKHLKRDFSFVRHGVTFHMIKTMGFSRAPSFFWLDTILIRKALQEIQPDLVHAIGTERGAALVATRLRYPYLITIQGLMSWIQETVPLSWHDTFAAALERYTFKRAHAVSVESKFCVRYLQKKYSTLKIKQIEHVPDRLFHEVARNPQIMPFRFLFVGTFSFAKGADLLLKSLDMIRSQINFQLIIIGNGEPEFIAELKAKVSPALWEKIEFKGIQSSEAIALELSRATMLICPTRVDTGPVAVKEAVVAGVPILGSAVGGIPDYVVEGKNGVLFPSGDLEGCCFAILEACWHPLFSKGEVDATVLREKRSYLSPSLAAANFLLAYRELVSF